MTESRFQKGLTSQTASMRLKQEGFNELPVQRKRTLLHIFREIILEPMFALLLTGALVYLLLGDLFEALVLLVFACLSVAITVIQEARSEKLLDKLRDLSAPRARVIRDGVATDIPSREVVRYDIMLLTEGDKVAADATILDAHDLQLDESLLTGESVPVAKVAKQSSSRETKISTKADQDLSTVYAGTLVVSGEASVTVFATGARTELGKIGASLNAIDVEQPQLKKQIRGLVTYSALIGAGVAISATILSAILRGSWLQAILNGIAIGMSLIPEEFPLIIAVFMAMGAWRISRTGVLTRRLAAIETLGAITVLCSDKTGTVTENKMFVMSILGQTSRWEKDLTLEDLEIIQALTSARYATAEIPTDPMDLAITRLFSDTQPAQSSTPNLICSMDLRPTIFAFANVYQTGSNTGTSIYLKGAFEAVAALCKLAPECMQSLSEEVNRLASRGLRVLALAKLSTHDWTGADNFRNTIQNYRFDYCGLIAFGDPLRQEVPPAIQQCKTADIKVIMITGDHPTTASAIAQQAGIGEAMCITGDKIETMSDEALATAIKHSCVFARIRPHQKLRIVNSLKQSGEIVAMTGDGVNDAPALKSAHVGIAMGKRGTQVARDAADLVLMDDNFASIVNAISLGRRIHDNLCKAIEYIVAVHIPIAGLALIPLLVGFPLMLTPIHIAFLEMIIDPACSVVFEAEPEEKNVMQRPPRDKNASLISTRQLSWSLVQGLFILIILLFTLAVGVRQGVAQAELRAVIFAQLVVMNIGLILINRSFNSSFANTFASSNHALWILITLVTSLLSLALFWNPVQHLFGFGAVGLTNLMVSLLLAIIAMLMLVVVKQKASLLRNIFSKFSANGIL